MPVSLPRVATFCACRGPGGQPFCSTRSDHEDGGEVPGLEEMHINTDQYRRKKNFVFLASLPLNWPSPDPHTERTCCPGAAAIDKSSYDANKPATHFRTPTYHCK